MILGRFYFKQTANGNLLGEFSNYTSNRILTESADLISDFLNPFEGRYRSTWMEENAESLGLDITNTNGIFTLVWNNNSQPVFLGQGFIVDGIMIGDYRDIEMENIIGELISPRN